MQLGFAIIVLFTLSFAMEIIEGVDAQGTYRAENSNESDGQDNHIITRREIVIRPPVQCRCGYKVDRNGICRYLFERINEEKIIC